MKRSTNLKAFADTLTYCVTLSIKASSFYTFARLVGRILTPACGIATTFVLKNILDTLSMSTNSYSDRQKLILLLALSLGLTLLHTGIQKVLQYCQTIHNDLIHRQIAMLLMDKTSGADLEFFDNPKYYDKISAASSDSYALVNLLWNVIECIASGIAFVGAFIILSGSNWLYGVAVTAAAFPAAIAGARYIKAIYYLSLEQIKGERSKHYINYITTERGFAMDVRLFGIADYLRKRYLTLWNAIFSDKRKAIKKRSVTVGLLGFLPEIVIAAITVDVSFKVLSGGATIGDYSLYAGLAAQLYGSISMVTQSVTQIYDDRLRINNIKSLDEFENHIENSGTQTINRVRTIEFRNVSFAYPGTDKLVLDDISFLVADGEKVALVGVNGSGKTTIIKLLLRYYNPTYGTVLVNGIDICNYKPDSLRRCFSVYFQDAFNYAFTLRDNITISDLERERNDDDILQTLADSQADDILKAMKNGLDTYIGRVFEDDGAELSGGQRQKIALARTFYRRHSALILDEPSSNLDPEAEHRVFEALRRLSDGKTTLFTSHRLSNVTLADRIIVIEYGKIIEQGTQLELLRNNDRYAELFDYQRSKFVTEDTADVSSSN